MSVFSVYFLFYDLLSTNSTNLESQLETWVYTLISIYCEIRIVVQRIVDMFDKKKGRNVFLFIIMLYILRYFTSSIHIKTEVYYITLNIKSFYFSDQFYKSGLLWKALTNNLLRPGDCFFLEIIEIASTLNHILNIWSQN